MSISTITELLSTHSGRDKLVRTIGYSSLFLSGIVKNKELSGKFQIISSKLSSCRAILRLFDDLPMLNYTLTYGLGGHESDQLLRVLGVFANAVDQIYYPIEHVAWAADHKLLVLKNGSDSWWLASTVCWVLSIYLTLLRALRQLSIIRKQRAQCISDVRRQASLRAEHIGALLTAVQSVLDLGHAVHWLPDGVLWGGSVSPWQRGLMGTVSSLIGLYRALRL